MNIALSLNSVRIATRRRKWQIICGLIAIAIILFGIKWYMDLPRDLSPELQYIGQSKSGGCFLLYCESEPINTFYFGTDLSREDLRARLKGVTFSPSDANSASYALTHLTFAIDGTDRSIMVTYYDEVTNLVHENHLTQTYKQHAIGVWDSDYMLIKEALHQ